MTTKTIRAYRKSWRYSVDIGVRTLAGSLGAYGLAALFAAAIARAVPASRVEAATMATLLAYLLIPAVSVWAFLARSAARAWLGIAGLAILLGATIFLAGSPA